MDKTGRHSFQKSKFGDSIDMPKNKFGHTKLNDQEDNNILPEDKMTNKIDASGNISAETSVDLDSVLNNMEKIIGLERLDKQMVAHNIEVEEDESHPEQISPVINLPVLRQKFSAFSEDDFTHYSFNNEDSEEEDLDEENNNYTLPTVNSKTFQNLDIKPRTNALKTVKKQPKNEEIEGLCTNNDCGFRIPENARFCNHCGSPQFNILGRHCINCGHKFSALEKFCPECGYTR